ncbi:MAG: response regulator [Deltaproteobacteria bacterium]|nr:response regulator [Deltaproteobacteria bacterium]
MVLQGNILVIDDDIPIQNLLHDFLSESGYNVITSSNPQTALEKLKETSVDLIITDLMMPGMNGMDLLKAVRFCSPNIPVVMITAYQSVDTAVKATKEGASDFISKPFSLEQIKFVVKKAMEDGKLRKQQKRRSTDKTKEAETIGFMSQNLQEKIRELSALYTISETLHYPLTMVELFEKVVELASSITESEKAGVWLFDRENKELTLKATKGMEMLLGRSFPVVDAGLVGEVFTEKRYCLSQDHKTCMCGTSRIDFKHPFLGVPILIGKEIFAALHLCQKIGGTHFSSNDVSIMTSLAEKASIKIENLALYEQLIDNIMYSISSLIKATDARDNYTMNHCKRVTMYAVKLAKALRCSADIIDTLNLAGPIHDVGKIGVRDNILLKQGGLDKTERDVMKTHATIGDDIVMSLNLGPEGKAVVRNHHERFDGDGYPDGLKGAAIPLIARIFAIADTYDAMTSNRPYRTARSHEETIAELLRCRGTQYDGDVVDIFVKHDICKEDLGSKMQNIKCEI